MKKYRILTLAAAAVLASGTPFTSSAQEPAPTLAFTPNMQAANGPIPGDLSLYEEELIGPKDKCVLLLTNCKKNNPAQPMKAAFFSGSYKEQLTWRDAATGKLLAESDYFEPLTVNSLTPPGFGGRIYFPTIEDFITLQVLPAGAGGK
jgi:hypothetical protein